MLSSYEQAKALPVVVPRVQHTLDPHDMDASRLHLHLAGVLQALNDSSNSSSSTSASPGSATICINAAGVLTAVCGQATESKADTSSVSDCGCARQIQAASGAAAFSSTSLLEALQPHMLLALQHITAVELQLPRCSRR
jgi:hypothetical protein